MGEIIARLKACAAELGNIAEALEKVDASKEMAKPLTLEDVRTALAEKSRMGFTAEVRGILTTHGANRLSEVDPGEYAVILKEAESLGK